MSVRKYLSIFKISVRDQLQYLPAFLSRNIFFLIILFIFYSLWRVIFSERSVVAGYTIVQTLWYLTFTETIELSKPRAFQQIQEEVKDGTIAYALLRPYSYVFFNVPRFLGESLVRIFPIMIEGFIVAAILVGFLPGYFRALPFGLILILGGIIINVLWYTAIGLLAFWTEEVSPFYWIIQKLVFILGGVFLPIDFFPPLLGRISRALPFAFVAYWPAKTMVAFSFKTFVTALAGQWIYIAVFLALLTSTFAAARKKVHVQGG